MSNINKPRVKVTVKPVKPTKPIRVRVNVSLKDCPEYEIFRKCRENKLMIRGNTANLRKILKYKETGVYHMDDSYYARKFLDQFLYHLGCTSSNSPMVNDSDCVTCCHFSAIPKSHYFEVLEAGCVYVYDVRTLNSEESLFNQFTHAPLDNNNILRLKRKIKWMEKYGYPVKFEQENEKELGIGQLTTNVVNHINRHHYMDRMWFEELDLVELKELYLNLHDLWNYRLELSEQEKSNLIPPDGIFCPNVELIRNYTEHMEEKLRREILIFVDKLTQNRVGAIYFMLGLVLVSDNAASSYPDLYQTAYPVDDE